MLPDDAATHSIELMISITGMENLGFPAFSKLLSSRSANLGSVLSRAQMEYPIIFTVVPLFYNSKLGGPVSVRDPTFGIVPG